MKKRLRIVLLAIVIMSVCVAGFVFGSRLYRAKTVVSTDPEMIPGSFEQVQDTTDQIEITSSPFIQDKNDPLSSEKAAPVNERAVDTWSDVYAGDLERTDARIHGLVYFDTKTTYVEEGFYLGTSPDYLSKNSKGDSVVREGKGAKLEFTMSKYGRTLKAGTTYYYQLYIIDKNGNEYTSNVYSFTTYQ